uniref:Uncharacterized protein n=1 Tax=Arundo donax TaxID=35708 RepID=A0A0A9EA31_ARUDO
MDLCSPQKSQRAPMISANFKPDLEAAMLPTNLSSQPFQINQVYKEPDFKQTRRGSSDPPERPPARRPPNPDLPGPQEPRSF